MIDLEHAQARIGIPIGEGVEAGAEHHVLPDPGGDGFGERVLRQAAVHGQKCGGSGRGDRPETTMERAQRRGLRRAQDRQGERVLVECGLSSS